MKKFKLLVTLVVCVFVTSIYLSSISFAESDEVKLKKYNDMVGKKYWVTSIYFPKVSGAGLIKSGDSFTIESLVTSSGDIERFKLIFDNGKVGYVGAINLYISDTYTGTDPAAKFLGKQFWIVNNIGSSLRTFYFRKGSCNSTGREVYDVSKGDSFLVTNANSGLGDIKYDVSFINGDKACIGGERLDQIYYFTVNNPIKDENNLKTKLTQQGIIIGKSVWLKHPISSISGLTQLYIKNIYINITDIRIEFETEYHKAAVFGVWASAAAVGVNEDNSKLQQGVISDRTYQSAEDFLDDFYLEYPKYALKWNKKVLKTIREQKIFIGMTPDQVILSRGRPLTINKSVGNWGLHEQWVYGDSSYLYFERNKLKSWQN